MDFDLFLLPQAFQEWEKVIENYNLRKENLGFEVYQEIENHLEMLKKEAFLHQIRYKNSRVAFTPRFNFAIYYQIRNKTIVVLAILHQKEDETKILDRF